jgi:hypothetical protein
VVIHTGLHKSLVRPVGACDCEECTCLHPIQYDALLAGLVWLRACALCGFGYNRTVVVLRPLREQCEGAWKIDFRKIKLDDEDVLEIAG